MNAPAAKPVLAPPSLLDVFQLRCEARALLVRELEMELCDAVDGLQLAAEEYSLIEAIGQDAVQAIMADAFAAVWPELALDPTPEPRKYDPPPLDAEPRNIARSTLDAAEYLVRENDPKRFKTFLLQHSTAERDAIIAHIDKCRGRSYP